MGNNDPQAGKVYPLDVREVDMRESGDGVLPLYGTLYFGFAVAPDSWPQLHLYDDDGGHKTVRGNPVLLGSLSTLSYELAVELNKAAGYDKDAIREAVISKLDEYLDALDETD